MSASSVEAKRVPTVSSNAVIVKLLNAVQGNVNRSTGHNRRHFARPCSPWKSESVEKRKEHAKRMSPQEHAKVIRLVGRKCIVKCLLNG